MRIAIFVAVSLIGADLAAGQSGDLSNNPFARPPSTIPEDARPVVSADGSSQALDLRATMTASNSRLANVAGRILRPGDEVQGFTLLRVFEDRAVFIHQGKRLTIYVKPDLVEDND